MRIHSLLTAPALGLASFATNTGDMPEQHDPRTPSEHPDQDWFWARPQPESQGGADEPTRALPPQGGADGPTQALPTQGGAEEPTRVLPTHPTWPADPEATRSLPPSDAQHTQQLAAPAAASGAMLQAPATQQAATTQQAPASQPDWTPPGEAGSRYPVTAPAYLAGGGPGAAGPDQAAAGSGAGGGAVPPGWQPPAGQPWGQPPGPQQPGKPGGSRRGRGMLAMVAVGAVASLALTQAPSLIGAGSPVAQPGASQSYDPNALDPANPADRQGGSAPTQDARSGPDTSSPRDGSSAQDPSDGVPAEQQPWDPWGESDRGSQQQPSSEQTTATAAQGVGVVLISTSSSSAQGAGSGMVLSSDGYVLTNYHVVQSSTEVQVEVASTGRSYTATVVGHDASQDVALLKLADATGLQTVTIDDDGDPAVGDTVTAVGNSEGQGYLSAAEGRVTATDASITVSSETASSGSESLTDVLKTTAGALPGDSGGPMFDDEGEVVGITTAGEQASTGARTQAVTVASYAVPIQRAMAIVQQIEDGQESGSVKVGPNAYLGVSVLTSDAGTMTVSSVVPDGPADAVGIGRGAVITGLDGHPVASHADLAALLAGKEPGDQVSIRWTDASGLQRSGSIELGSSPVN